MTTTIKVKARGYGAKVDHRKDDGSVNTTRVPPNTQLDFHIDAGDVFSVQQLDAVEEPTQNDRPFQGEPVPGAAENDALLGNKTNEEDE